MTHAQAADKQPNRKANCDLIPSAGGRVAQIGRDTDSGAFIVLLARLSLRLSVCLFGVFCGDLGRFVARREVQRGA